MPSSDRPAVSIIIPLHNKIDYATRTIESVLGQDFRDCEIIVVDDGSTDGSGDIAQEYADQIRYVWQERAGAGAARNRGIALARGDFIAFLDADDPWFSNKLAWQVAFMNDHPDIRWCSTNYYVESGPGLTPRPASSFDGDEAQSSWIEVDWFAAMAAGRIAFQTSGVLLRRSLVDEVGVFDITIPSGQDFDFWVRIAEQYPTCGYCETPCYTFSRDAIYSITRSEVSKYVGKVPMLTKFIERSLQPGRPPAYQALIRHVCERIIRESLAWGSPGVARDLLRAYPPDWRALRHRFYMLLSYLPAPVLRLATRLLTATRSFRMT